MPSPNANASYKATKSAFSASALGLGAVAALNPVKIFSKDLSTSEEVKKGSIWTAEIRKKSVQNMVQRITYKVRKITMNEVYIDISGTISYGSDDVKGGGKIKGMMRVNRNTGLNTTTKIIQDYKMNINGYKAKGINTIEVKTVLIEN